MSLSARISAALLAHRKPAGARGDEKSAKKVDKHDKFEETGRLSASKKNSNKIAHAIMKGRK